MATDTTLKLTEPWQLHGEWWLPGDKTVLSAGTLVYDPNSGAKLVNVVGGLAKSRSTGEGPQIILGQTNGGAVTLVQTHCERTSSLIPDADFAVELVVIKRHFSSVESIRFNKFHVRYANLNNWIERGNPVHRVRKSFCGILQYIVPTKWSSLWDLTYKTTKIRLRAGQGLVVGGVELTFSEIHDHQFTYQEPTGLESFYQDERSIRSLLDIFSNAQMQVERIWGEDSIPFGEMEIFHKGRFGRNFRRDSQRGKIPIPFSSVRKRLSSLLSQWLEMRDKLEPTLGVFLLGLHDPNLNIENVFLSVMQALEAFHRSFYPSTYIPQADYESKVRPVLVAAIPEDLSSDFKSSLKKKFEHANEVSLRRRLKELLAKLPADAVFQEARNSDFNSRTVNTRNLYTHVVTSKEVVFESHSQLFYSVFVWQEVMVALVLRELGFESSVMVHAIKQMQEARPRFIET